MKKAFIVLAAFIAWLHIACSEEKETMAAPLFGSGELRLNFLPVGGTQEVVTERSAWCISSVMLNGKNLSADPSVTFVQNDRKDTVEVKSASFSFKKKDNILEVKLQPIVEDKAREFTVNLREGDDFNYLYVFQK